MSTTRLSSRGQVVLPKNVREKYHWTSGQEFEVVETDEGILLRAQSPFPDTTFDEVPEEGAGGEGVAHGGV